MAMNHEDTMQSNAVNKYFEFQLKVLVRINEYINK